MTTTKKNTAQERIAQFMAAGKKLVKGDDYSKVTAAGIARLCKCSAPLVFAHFANRDTLRAALRKFIASGTVPNAKPAKRTVVAVVKKVAPKPKVAKKAAAPKPKVAKPAAKKAAAPKPKKQAWAKAAPKPKPSPKLAPMPAPAGAQ